MTSSSEPDVTAQTSPARPIAAKKAAAKKKAAARAKAARVAERETAASKPKPKAAQKPAAKPKPQPAPPVAGPVRMKRRHFGIVFSFLLFVLAPIGAAGYYLYEYAQDQFVSEVGFTVRREEAPVVSSLISSLGQVSSASSSDSDILFEFIRSKELVQRADEQLDLRSLYAQNYDIDPVFALKPDATIEELGAYWQRMVRVSYAPSTGLLELEVRAFDAQSAQKLAQLIFTEGSQMINELSSIAREDSTRYAREDLDGAEDELGKIREVLTTFRLRTQIVDPQAAIQGQMGLLNSLQQQLGEALIEFDLLENTARAGDPRLTQIEARIAAIQSRIAQERQKFGQDGDAIGGQDYATVIAEFERLLAEREFSEQKYATALSNLNVALTEAQRQSRYLAAYVGPTLAESAEHPQRPLLLALFSLFTLLIWSILTLVYYSIRDRR
jgi:capsular polysaccharide transport system permease protein